ncbi:MAG: Stk1 family PASTA domain-containing Ser/Thr kinase, partial [Actinomycetales bacterium]
MTDGGTPRTLGGRYEVGELLGRGGMAEVHRGQDLRLGRPVAVKLLRPDLARDPLFQARFRREAQSAAALNHPSVVAVYDTGEDTDQFGTALPYIVMEYVQGTTLRQLLDSDRRLMPTRAFEIAAGILAALDYSHRHGIVHRDIKPANVMLTRTGDVKVMDFGIARAMSDTSATMTQTSAVIGTAQYLSPEQARGENVDPRSDIYSTGCLLYELLTGRPPFVGDSPVAVAYQHVREEAAPPSALNPDVTPDMDAVVMKSLAKEREQRYQTAGEMRADIERVLTGAHVLAPAAVAAPTIVRGPDVAAAYGVPTAATTTLPRMRPDEPAPQQRRTWAYLLLALAVVVVFLLAAFAGSKLLGGGGGTKKAIPTVIGQTLDQARSNLETFGIPASHIATKPVDATGQFTKPNTVADQDPKGTLVDPATVTVTLDVVTAPDQVNVPDGLVGMTADEATAALTKAGLTVGTTDEQDSDKPQGTVLSTDPASGTPVDKGSAVALTVASGSNAVPNVQGADVDAATQTLTGAGFKVATINVANADNAPGTVLDQDPKSGQAEPLG